MDQAGPGSEVRPAESDLVAVDVSLGDAPPRYLLRGDDVAAVAFLPSPSKAEPHDRVEQAWNALCARSAGAPPSTFEDEGALLGFLRTRRHLGALALIGARLYLDDEGEPVRVCARLLSPRLGAGFVTGEHNVGSPIDRQRHEVQKGDGTVRLICWQHFGLGSVIEPRGRFDADAPRPLGWIRVSCDLDRDGGIRVHLACSYLPTIWFYRDGMRVHRESANERTAEEIDAVLRPAPSAATGTTHRRLDGFGYLRPLLGDAR